ncbi:MAG: DUF2851 family protein [Cyclobacteriaceae bacterium]
MREDLLHYLWKHRSFDQVELKTTCGRSIQILKPGFHNHNAGPDFLEAQIRIDAVAWFGSVELHIKSSDWYQHKHDSNSNYDNVILHVVWEEDRKVFHRDGQLIPCLEIRDLTDTTLLYKYKELTCQISDIPCQFSIQSVPSIIQQSMLENVAVERLKAKAKEVLKTFNSLNQDWEETSYRLIMRAFGTKVNKVPMLRLAELMPFRLLKKYLNEPDTCAALLFGQAGLLLRSKHAYVESLNKRFQYLKHKHSLKTSLDRPQWKFSRMRPANFPSLRLAQYSAFITQNPFLYGYLIELSAFSEIERLFKVSTHTYWEDHYDFNKVRNQKSKPIVGKQMVEHLVINVFSPLLTAVSVHFDQSTYMDRALQLLKNTPSESNTITRKLKKVGIETDNALTSQGALALYYNYCLKKNCLQCNIGGRILRQ